MLYLPSSLATRAVRLRSVNFGAVHERMHIPCADRSRCELCFHLDVSTAEIGYLLPRYKLRQPLLGASFLPPSSGDEGTQKDS